MTSTGEFVIGRLDGEDKPELDFLADTLGEVVPTLKTQNIYGHLYSKLIINSCITTLRILSLGTKYSDYLLILVLFQFCKYKDMVIIFL